jgi:hypothetical protein
VHPGEDLVRFTDLSSGADVTLPRTLAVPDQAGQHPRHLRVETGAARAVDFADVVEPLRVVFRASVESGNPVHWC